MEQEKNMVKYEIYKTMHENLKRAMKYGFFYEAIFIEYAILEDRSASAILHAGLPVTDSKGSPFGIAKKFGILKNKEPFTSPAVRRRLPCELLEEADAWRESRNTLIHKLATTPYDSEQVKAVAEEGNRLCKEISNKVKSVNRYFEKQREDN